MMTTERYVWEKCKHDLIYETTAKYPNRQHTHLEVLASARALIVNPSTTNETISNVLETLVQCLQQDQKPLHHRVLSFLSDLASNCNFSHKIFNAVLAYATVHKDDSRLTAEALTVIITIAEQNQSSSSASVISELNEDIFLSLCLSSSPSVRSWVLLNASRFSLRPFILATVLLEFTKDPYPYVRRDALSGLVNFSNTVDTQESKLIEGCYDRAVELLLDNSECVRSVAVDVVSQWGYMLATSDNEVSKDWSDAVFVQLCSMARDMNMEVRTKAFTALGTIKLVSEDILLQTLSKKVLGGIKSRRVTGKCTAKEFDIQASRAAGVFIHAFEDEFYEVRRSACKSLGILAIFSVRFANGALNLLTELLNDDAVIVRLQSLETMFHMVKYDRLKVQGTEMHKFLGTLADASTLIRCASRNVLRLMKMTNVEFKLSIDGLLTNLESYPECMVGLAKIYHAGTHEDTHRDWELEMKPTSFLFYLILVEIMKSLQ